MVTLTIEKGGAVPTAGPSVAPVGELARKLMAAKLPGPVLVMLGTTIGRAEASEHRAARQQHG